MYRRPPGFTPTYSARQTASYVSRKARLKRGLALSPTDRERSSDGWILYFGSSRGPEIFAGRHRVTALRNEFDDDGGGGGDDGAIVPPLMASYYFVAQMYWFFRGSYDPRKAPSQQPSRRPTSGFSFPEYFVGNPPTEYLRTPGGESEVNWERTPTKVTITQTNYVRGVWFTIPVGSRVTYEYLGGSSLSHRWRAWVGETVVTQFTYNQRSFNNLDYDDPRWDDPTWETRVDQVYLLRADTFDPVPWFPPGPGSPVPDGYLGDGRYVYRCSCPDYTHSEKPYHLPLFPSHNASRSWGQIKPTQPCKHMVSAASALADAQTLRGWIMAASPDLDLRPRLLTDGELRQIDRKLNPNARRAGNWTPTPAFLQRQAQRERDRALARDRWLRGQQRIWMYEFNERFRGFLPMGTRYDFFDMETARGQEAFARFMELPSQERRDLLRQTRGAIADAYSNSEGGWVLLGDELTFIQTDWDVQNTPAFRRILNDQLGL